MIRLATSSSVAVSLGSLGLNRMIPSGSRRAPATSTRPSTSNALTRIEPRIAVCATISWWACSANSTTKNSGRLPSVDCIIPVVATPNRPPTCSVENDTIQAPPASARPATMKATTLGTPLTYRATPASTVSSATPPRPARSTRVRPDSAPYPPVSTVSSSEYGGAQQHNSTSGSLPSLHSLCAVPGGITTQSPAVTSDSSD